MVQNKNNIIKFKPKPKPLKYYICEFFKRYGEDENTYHYIFSNRNIDDMGYTGEDDDHKILSQFFLQRIYKKDRDKWSGNMYWTNSMDALVRFDGMQEVKPSEFSTLEKARVYVCGSTLPLNK